MKIRVSNKNVFGVGTHAYSRCNGLSPVKVGDQIEIQVGCVSLSIYGV